MGRARVTGGTVSVAGVAGTSRRAGARAVRRRAAGAGARAQPDCAGALRHAHAVGQPGTSSTDTSACRYQV